MSDSIETLNGSVIQHGKYNDRIYLMKLGNGDVKTTIEQLQGLAESQSYTKIIVKVPARALPEFEAGGYRLEASVPRFYGGEEHAFFMAKYLADERSIERDPETVRNVLTAARDKAGEGVTSEPGNGFDFFVADETDADEISRVYARVFDSYPFPIYEKDYVLETMRDNVVYFCIRESGRIVSVASSEMDREAENVEMTDFATLPEHRGNSFAVFLLDKMEQEMSKRGIRTAYTIARSVSFGMNITFARLRYHYGGTLTNNTNICGRMESMNIWYKPLPTVGSGRDRSSRQMLYIES